MSEAAAPAADILALDGIVQVFRQGQDRIEVLKGVDLRLRPGEMVGLLGPSGSGKSTLLHIAGLLERPAGGTIRIAGREVGRMGDAQRTELRRSTIGFVYQFHHLLPEFSALENVALPQIVAGRGRKAAKADAAGLLARVGLAQRTRHRPAQLSGGEQQRVAIARALANTPRLLLADEPTGNLDQRTAEEVFAMLVELVHGAGIGAVFATHNLDLARRMDRVVEMQDGRLVEHRPVREEP